VKKHRSNSQYFKGKKLQSKIFNQLNIKKVKSTKIILKKINKKKAKSWKKKSHFGKKGGNLKKKDEKKKRGMHCRLLL
jgi:hypothetical protein